MKPTLIEQLDAMPPALTRLCAKKGFRRKSLAEISKEAGLSMRKTRWIARQGTWRPVKIGDAMRFAKACGVDLLRPRKSRFYLMRIWLRGPRGIRHLSRGIGLRYVMKQLTKMERSNNESTGVARGGKD